MSDDAPEPSFELRSAALDAWCGHLLKCTTCTQTDGLCGVAAELVVLLADQLDLLPRKSHRA